MFPNLWKTFPNVKVSYKSFSRNLCNLENRTEFNKNVIYYFCVFWEIYLKLI